MIVVAVNTEQNRIMAKKTKSKKEFKNTINIPGPASPTEGLSYWRAQAAALWPDQKDKWKQSELATTLKMVAGLIEEHWDEVDRACGKSKNSKASAGFKITINREQTPPTVTVNGGFSEAHKWKAESDVADPDQDELPGMVSTEPKTESVPAPEPESEDPPRVTSADEAKAA
jgi:hypothetical protein